MKMADMKRSKQEIKERSNPIKVGEDQYPYGLRIDLDHEQLKKMGIDKLPSVGSHVHLKAKARVHMAEESNHHEQGKRRRVSIQIEHLGMHAKDESEPASAKDALEKGISDADKDINDGQ